MRSHRNCRWIPFLSWCFLCVSVQDMYSVPRTILPHGASYNGHPITLHVTYESTKDTFTLEVFLFFSNTLCAVNVCRWNALLTVCVPCVLQTHSNETIASIRWKIAEHLSCPVDNVQIFANDSVVSVINLLFIPSSPHQVILLDAYLTFLDTVLHLLRSFLLTLFLHCPSAVC